MKRLCLTIVFLLTLVSGYGQVTVDANRDPLASRNDGSNITATSAFRNNLGIPNHEKVTVDNSGRVGIIGASIPTIAINVTGTAAAAINGPTPTGIARCSGITGAAVTFGVLPSAPWSGWIQAGDKTSYSTYPLSLQPLGNRVTIASTTDDGANALQCYGPASMTSIRAGGAPAGSSVTSNGDAANFYGASYGSTPGNVNIFANQNAAVQAGASLGFGGGSGGAVNPYLYAMLKGIKDVAGADYSGALTVVMPSSAGSFSEKARINSRGAVLIASTTDDGVNTLQVNGPASISYFTGNASDTLAAASSGAAKAGLDVWNGGPSILLGGNIGANTRTNATVKTASVLLTHYTNAEEPVCLLYTSSTAAATDLRLGGGNGYYNSATSVGIYTAANAVTTVSALRLGINNTGQVFIATTTPMTGYDLTVASGAWFGHDVSAETFTDRSAAPDTLAQAYEIVNSHESKKRESGPQQAFQSRVGNEITNCTNWADDLENG